MAPIKMSLGARAAAGARDFANADHAGNPDDSTSPAAKKGRPFTAQKRWHAANPIAAWSYSAVRSAERRGLISRPAACDACGADGPVDAHHDDHMLPLAVRWWCRRCHRQRHAARRRAGV